LHCCNNGRREGYGVATRRRTEGAGGFFGIERMSKRTMRIAVGGLVVMAAMISKQPPTPTRGAGTDATLLPAAQGSGSLTSPMPR
jgi:hypothetical protein